MGTKPIKEQAFIELLSRKASAAELKMIITILSTFCCISQSFCESFYFFSSQH
jgi:hypothetical protein